MKKICAAVLCLVSFAAVSFANPATGAQQNNPDSAETAAHFGAGEWAGLTLNIDKAGSSSLVAPDRQLVVNYRGLKYDMLVVGSDFERNLEITSLNTRLAGASGKIGLYWIYRF